MIVAVVVDLPPFLQGIAADLTRVETELSQGFGAYDPMLQAAGSHLLKAGGKRLRPVLVLLWGRAMGGIQHGHDVLAGALELLHTATLIHDDVIDQAALRRGLPSVNHLWDDRVSVIAGDFLLAHASLLVTTLGINDLTALCATTVKEICEGEILQYQGRFNLELSLERYRRQIAYKTGALLACGTKGAALISGGDLAMQEAAHRFGNELGICFQIVDDLLDFTGDVAAVGKPLGHDLRQGFLTAPTLLALADPTAGPTVRRAIQAGFDDPDRLDEAIDVIRDCGAVAMAERMADEAAEQAITLLDVLPAGSAHDDLQALVDYVRHRDR